MHRNQLITITIIHCQIQFNFNVTIALERPIDHIRILSIGLELACNGG